MNEHYRRPQDIDEKVARRIARYPKAIALVEEGKASEQTRLVVGLLREGLNGIEIGERTGISRSRVYELLNDPLGHKTAIRKTKRQRPCVDCGHPCNTDGSVTDPSERCSRCAMAKRSAEAKWQPEAVIVAIQRWAAEHDGRPPKAQEWNSGPYSHPDYIRGGWPAWNTCAFRFGSFNNAIRAAGFKPHFEHGGQPRTPLTREQLADTATLVQEHGLAGAARVLGMTPSGVKRRMKAFNNEPTGANNMSAPRTAEGIIDRELEKLEARAQRLREELSEVEGEAARFKIARNALRQLPALSAA